MKARELGYIAVSTALFCVSAWIAFPIGGIPVTLQTLTLCLAAGLLGAKRALLATLAYLLLGLIGVPVFAGFAAGVGALFSPTGGYLIGFLALSVTTGLASDLLKERRGYAKGVYLGLSMGLGLLICYAFGTVWFTCVASAGKEVGLWGGVTICVLPYLPFDTIKIVFAVFLVQKLQKYMKMG